MKTKNEKKNLLLLDSAPQKEWIFKEYLEKTTGWKWEIRHAESHFSDKKWKRVLKFFTFPAKLFVKRKEISTIISYQQFYGLIYAFYCSVFHVKKTHKLIITMFIYRPKTGLPGKIYYNFLKKIVNSSYVDKIVCFSKTEPSYYKELFAARENLFTYVPLALGDVRSAYEQTESCWERFVLSVGKSNRDYNFLVHALGEENYPVRILCDTYKNEHLPDNIKLYDNVFGDAYLKMLAECYCVVVPLADIHISAGQLVFLQSMMLGKPVIVTKSDTVTEYIIDGVNGFVIEKEKESLLGVLKQLYTDDVLYHRQSEQARKMFEEVFSLEKMAEKIGSFLLTE